MAGPVELLESATVGLAVGTAAADAFTPAIESARQEAWKKHPVRVLAAHEMAELVAEGATDRKTAYERASRSGYSPNAVDAMVELVLTAPGVSEGLTMLRRGFITTDQFKHFLRKSKFEPMWDGALLALQHDVLSPPDLALGVIRGNLPVPEVNGEPVVPLGGSYEGSNVPLDPVANIDAIKEGAMSGLDADRMATIIRNVGLPPGVITGLNMLNRGIINEAAFYLLVAQSDARLSWGPFLLKLRRMLLTPHEYAELELRGWISREQRDAGAAMHGMEPADTQLLFEMLGRPLGIHAITTGLARGGTFQPQPGETTDPYQAYVHQASLRPEFYDLAIANKYTLPSAFVIRALLKDGAITADQGNTLLLQNGWPPEWARLVANHYAASTTGTVSPAVRSADTAAVRAVQKAYVQQGLSQTAASTELTTLGEDPATFPDLFKTWDVSRTAYLQGLSNTQLRNRYRNMQLSEADAIALLESRGLTAAEAAAYLTASSTTTG